MPRLQDQNQPDSTANLYVVRDYQWNVRRTENYHDVMLKNFDPFMHLIELAPHALTFKP